MMKRILKSAKKELRVYELWLFLLPAIAVIFIFRYIPMYGAQIAFRDFRPRLGFSGSPWVGLQHYVRFFNSDMGLIAIRNTVTLSLYGLIAHMPVAIMLALMFHSLRNIRLKKFAQTVTYAPFFISTVVKCGMILIFTSPRAGIVPRIIEFFTGNPPPLIMGSTTIFPHLFVWTGVWQTTGWNSIIYLAALSGVSIELYEAAKVDGASRLQCIRHIDLPHIVPVAVTLLILNSGRIMSLGFEKAFLLQNMMNINASEIISTHVYRMGLLGGHFSYATAVDLFNSVVNLMLILIVNFLARRYSETSIF